MRVKEIKKLKKKTIIYNKNISLIESIINFYSYLFHFNFS